MIAARPQSPGPQQPPHNPGRFFKIGDPENPLLYCRPLAPCCEQTFRLKKPVRVTLLANRDLASNFALNLLLPELSQRHELQVLCSDQVGSRPTAAGLDTVKFFEQTLPNELLFPLIDAQKIEGELLTFRGLSRYLDKPIASLNHPNTKEGLSRLAATRPDIVMCIRYGCILDMDALSIPRLGVLNLHSGKLPEYRGVMATFWAMLAGDDELCTTLHWIHDATIDTGPIISIQSTVREQSACYLSNTLRLYPTGCEAAISAINAVAAGDTLSLLERPASARYFSFPDETALAEGQSAGLQWVNPDFVARFLSRYQP